MKYNVNCNGAHIRANSMIRVAEIIAGPHGDAAAVYKNMVGRKPSAAQMRKLGAEDE